LNATICCNTAAAFIGWCVIVSQSGDSGSLHKKKKEKKEKKSKKKL
jgi:hypothetical protein